MNRIFLINSLISIIFKKNIDNDKSNNSNKILMILNNDEVNDGLNGNYHNKDFTHTSTTDNYFYMYIIHILCLFIQFVLNDRINDRVFER